MCLTRVTRENFTGFPREIHMLLLVGAVSFVYTLYKVHISLQHYVLILRKIFYHRK